MIQKIDIYEFISDKIKQLLIESKKNTRVLAELRRGLGKAPGDMPALWGYFLEDMDKAWQKDFDYLREAEWSVYTALTLFAMHQRGHDVETKPMHKEGMSLGKAVAQLVKDVDEKDRITRRFNMVATSSSIEELVHHMRGLVQLLSRDGIALDYASLASDLYRYQQLEQRPDVRLSWGQDYYWSLYKNTEKEENTEV